MKICGLVLAAALPAGFVCAETVSLLPPSLGFSEYYVPPVVEGGRATFENGMKLEVAADGEVCVAWPDGVVRYRTKDLPAARLADGSAPAWTFKDISVDYNGAVLNYASGAATLKRVFKAGRLDLDGRPYVGIGVAAQLSGAKLAAPCDPFVARDNGAVVKTSADGVSLEMPTGVDRPDEAQQRWFWYAKGAARGANERLALVQYVRRLLRGRYNRRDMNPFPGDAQAAAAKCPEAWKLCRGRPFVRETAVGTVWTGFDGGAVFFVRDAEDVTVGLPHGWTLRGAPDGLIRRAKAGETWIAENGDFK